jgi:ATP-binding cassette subfamily B protein
MLLALGALLIAAAAMLFLPMTLKNVIDEGFSAENVNAINRYFLWLLLAAAVFATCASISWDGSANAWSRTCAPPCTNA